MEGKEHGGCDDPDGKDHDSESVSRRSRVRRRITRDVVPISVEKRYLACGPHKFVTSAAATREHRVALERTSRKADRAGPRDRREIERWAGQGRIGPRCGFGPISVFFL